MDGEIAVAFQKGQPDRLSLLYQHYAPLVYTVALRSLGIPSALRATLAVVSWTFVMAEALTK